MTKGPLDRDLELAAQRPQVPGNDAEYLYLPARGFLPARRVKKGRAIRIIDSLGQQCADTVLWDAENLDNVLNCCMTMMINGRWNG